MTRQTRTWSAIIERAVEIVNGYSYLITLRQLHYRLVMMPGLGYLNNGNDYGYLSKVTAEARRQGTFPPLLDQTREIHRVAQWAGPQSALRSLAQQYRRDRTAGQEWLVVLGGEKATLLAQLEDWYNELGSPIVLLRGFSSQTYCDDVASMVLRDGRPAVLIYAGDFDPSGIDILRDFTARCPVFDKIEHIAVEPVDPDRMTLPINQGKGDDARANRFRETYPLWADYADDRVARGDWRVQRNAGRVLLPNVVQIEVEAIEPEALRALYEDTIERYWDRDLYDAVLDQEDAERTRLEDIAGEWEA